MPTNHNHTPRLASLRHTRTDSREASKISPHFKQTHPSYKSWAGPVYVQVCVGVCVCVCGSGCLVDVFPKEEDPENAEFTCRCVVCVCVCLVVNLLLCCGNEHATELKTLNKQHNQTDCTGDTSTPRTHICVETHTHKQTQTQTSNRKNK